MNGYQSNPNTLNSDHNINHQTVSNSGIAHTSGISYNNSESSRNEVPNNGIPQSNGTSIETEAEPTVGALTERFLHNKVALVTGSTSGIGLGIATALAQRGCHIVLNGFGDENLIASLQKRLRSFGVRVEYVGADLTKLEEIEHLCDRIKYLFPNGVDILVNNAGFQHVCPIENFPVEKWDAMISLMLTAPFHLIRLLLPQMKVKSWGRIINISSVHGLKASPNKTAYIAAKHGLVGLTKTVGLEAAAYGVTCMAICPGYVNTGLFQTQIKNIAEREGASYEETKIKFLSNVHASGQTVGIEQIAETATFLCSNAASQMTGSCIVLDGGWAAK